LTGDDYGNPPPAQALAARQIINNVRGFPVYGEYSRSDRARTLVDAVVEGRLDVAVMWGPIAGYFVRRERLPLDITAVAPGDSDAHLRFVFDMAMGVRRDDGRLAELLNGVIARRRTEMRRVLSTFGIPLLGAGHESR
jgi:ABC-type amino acid transport substrate-binding protein